MFPSLERIKATRLPILPNTAGVMMKPNTTNSPSFIEPMKALPVEKLPEGDWLYEIKFDGYRALAFKDGKDVRLVSRNNKAFDYPQLLDALKKLPTDRVVLQKLRRCPADLLRLRSAVPGGKRSAQTNVPRQA